eukprot:1841229-Pyramimonas_sp.AAC.1
MSKNKFVCKFTELADPIRIQEHRHLFFALLREFLDPRTTNSAGDAERKLRNFKFTTEKSKNIVQRA